MLFVETVLIGRGGGGTIVRHSGTVASPLELVLHYHCLNTRSVGLHEDAGIGAAIFPSDTKYLSDAKFVEFLQSRVVIQTAL